MLAHGATIEVTSIACHRGMLEARSLHLRRTLWASSGWVPLEIASWTLGLPHDALRAVCDRQVIFEAAPDLYGDFAAAPTGGLRAPGAGARRLALRLGPNCAHLRPRLCARAGWRRRAGRLVPPLRNLHVRDRLHAASHACCPVSAVVGAPETSPRSAGFGVSPAGPCRHSVCDTLCRTVGVLGPRAVASLVGGRVNAALLAAPVWPRARATAA